MVTNQRRKFCRERREIYLVLKAITIACLVGMLGSPAALGDEKSSRDAQVAEGLPTDSAFERLWVRAESFNTKEAKEIVTLFSEHGVVLTESGSFATFGFQLPKNQEEWTAFRERILFDADSGKIVLLDPSIDLTEYRRSREARASKKAWDDGLEPAAKALLLDLASYRKEVRSGSTKSAKVTLHRIEAVMRSNNISPGDKVAACKIILITDESAEMLGRIVVHEEDLRLRMAALLKLRSSAERIAGAKRTLLDLKTRVKLPPEMADLLQ